MKGKELYDLLRSKRISQESVAEKLGITSQTFGRRLKAQYLSQEFIRQVSDAVGFDVENPNPVLPSPPVGYISEATHKALVDELMGMISRKDDEIADLHRQLDALRTGAPLKKAAAG